MLYTICLVSSAEYFVDHESRGRSDGQGNSRGNSTRGTCMRRAILSARMAVLPVLAAQQEPPKPKVEEPQSQTKPAPGTPQAPTTPPAAGEIDPAKLASPRDPEIVKAAARLPVNDAPFILGAEDQIQI